MEEFVEDAVAGFDRVEVGGFEGWACDFFEPAADRGVSPGVGDVALAEQVLGVEVSRAFGWFDLLGLLWGCHDVVGYAGNGTIAGDLRMRSVCVSI